MILIWIRIQVHEDIKEPWFDKLFRSKITDIIIWDSLFYQSRMLPNFAFCHAQNKLRKFVSTLFCGNFPKVEEGTSTSKNFTKYQTLHHIKVSTKWSNLSKHNSKYKWVSVNPKNETPSQILLNQPNLDSVGRLAFAEMGDKFVRDLELSRNLNWLFMFGLSRKHLCNSATKFSCPDWVPVRHGIVWMLLWMSIKLHLPTSPSLDSTTIADFPSAVFVF